MDAATLAQFEQIISALMSPDNTVRNQAEAAYTQAKADPNMLMGALISLLRNNQSEQVRSMCAVLLRKAIIPSAGVLPNINEVLLPKKKKEPQTNNALDVAPSAKMDDDNDDCAPPKQAPVTVPSGPNKTIAKTKKTEKTEKSGKAGKAAKAAKAGKAGKVGKTGKTGKSEKVDKAEKKKTVANDLETAAAPAAAACDSEPEDEAVVPTQPVAGPDAEDEDDDGEIVPAPNA